MKYLLILCTFALCTVSLAAAEGTPKRLALFDTDGDGTLSTSEREQAREQIRQRWQAMSEDERRRAAERFRARLSERGIDFEALKARFDADGDGRLRGDERVQLRNHLRELRQQQQP